MLHTHSCIENDQRSHISLGKQAKNKFNATFLTAIWSFDRTNCFIQEHFIPKNISYKVAFYMPQGKLICPLGLLAINLHQAPLPTLPRGHDLAEALLPMNYPTDFNCHRLKVQHFCEIAVTVSPIFEKIQRRYTMEMHITKM